MESVSVSESIEGKLAWEGLVHVFDLEHCPAYAWSESIPGSTKRQFYATAHSSAIDSPAAAVRAAIAEEQRSRKGKS